MASGIGGIVPHAGPASGSSSPGTTASDALHVLPFGAVVDQGSSSDPQLQYLASLMTSPPAPGTYSSYSVTLKDGSNGTGGGNSSITTPGNFGAVSLPGESGANDYRNDIASNSTSKVMVGDWIDTKPGNMVGPTQQGLQDRLSSGNTAKDHYAGSYNDWYFGRSTYPVDNSIPAEVVDGVSHPYYLDPYRQDPNDAHIGVIPLITQPGKGGRAQVQVLGFAAFFIQDPNPSGSGSVVTGNFIGLTAPGQPTVSGSGGGGIWTTHIVAGS